MRIICFDLSSIFVPCWKMAEGKPLDQADAFKDCIARITKMREGYDVAVVACDAAVPDPDRTWKSAPSFRATIDKPRADPDDPNKRIGYKANREHRGAPYYDQLRRVKDRLRADGCHVFTAVDLPFDVACWTCDGRFIQTGNQPPFADCATCGGAGTVAGKEPSGYYIEADDIIGWVAEQYTDAAGGALEHGDNPDEWSLRIVSADFDVAQCIDDMLAIEVLSPAAGMVYHDDDIFKRFGVPPAKVANFKALAGDASDGYFPFRGAMGEKGKRKPGIGAETAKKLLGLFGGNAMAAVKRCMTDPPPDGVEPYTISLIRRHGETAARNGLALASLRTILPFKFAPVLEGPLPTQSIAQNDESDPPGDGYVVSQAVVDEFAKMREAGARMVVDAVSKTLAEPGSPQARGPQPGTQVDAGLRAVSPAPSTSTNPSPAARVGHSRAAGAVDGPPEVVGEPVTTPRVRVATPDETRALAVPSDKDERFELAPYALEPRTLPELKAIATHIVNARLFPKFGTMESVLAVIMMGRARGFPALVSLENAYTVGGQVAWKAPFIVGAVLVSGFCEYLAIESTGPKEAVAVTKRTRKGIGREQSLSFTIEEAEALEYLKPSKSGEKTSWQKQPAVMLRWRALVSLARMVYSDITAGMYSPDELREDGHSNDEETNS